MSANLYKGFTDNLYVYFPPTFRHSKEAPHLQPAIANQGRSEGQTSLGPQVLGCGLGLETTDILILKISHSGYYLLRFVPCRRASPAKLFAMHYTMGKLLASLKQIQILMGNSKQTNNVCNL